MKKVCFQVNVEFAGEIFSMVVGNGDQNIRKDSWDVDLGVSSTDRVTNSSWVSWDSPSFSMKDPCPGNPLSLR